MTKLSDTELLQSAVKSNYIATLVSKLLRLDQLYSEDSIVYDGDHWTCMEVIEQEINVLEQKHHDYRQDILNQAKHLEERAVAMADHLGVDLNSIVTDLKSALPLHRLSYWNEQLEKLERLQNDRLQEIAGLIDTIKELQVQMKLEEEDLDSNDASLQKLKELHTLTDNLWKLKAERHARYERVSNSINDLVNTLEKFVTTEQKQFIALEFKYEFPIEICDTIDGLTDIVLSNLERLEAHLRQLHQEAMDAVKKSIHEIQTYWKELGINQNFRLVESIENLVEYQEMATELCQKWVLEIESKIRAMLAEIKEYWIKCHVDCNHQRAFEEEIQSQSLNIFVREKLEDELHRLKVQYEHGKSIFETICKRAELLERMKHFEVQASDPKRLFRPSFQLLEEEKFRKTAFHDLVSLEQKITESILKFEHHLGCKFIYNGAAYLETLEQEKSERFVNSALFVVNCSSPRQSKRILTPQKRVFKENQRPIK